MSIRDDSMIVVGVAALAGLALWYVKKKVDAAGGLQGAAANVGAAAADAAGSVVSGTALGIGDVIGLPRTDKAKCQDALAMGNTFDASLYCPALDFLTGIVSPRPLTSAGIDLGTGDNNWGDSNTAAQPVVDGLNNAAYSGL
ncbi:hypothetical protein [Burkholderia sp. Tr-20390]|uniref:hypothetical protein n=1 Tax=Burkholderia sp. Tr-20390 TaxID=2703904 RepID=UPI0019817E3A|nr:hypothetical protein [Burkholderia sp. Tr-20390]MBN3734638.1 hypothetical protein [Burkholderia sp. Tr-20390]